MISDALSKSLVLPVAPGIVGKAKATADGDARRGGMPSARPPSARRRQREASPREPVRHQSYRAAADLPPHSGSGYGRSGRCRRGGCDRRAAPERRRHGVQVVPVVAPPRPTDGADAIRRAHLWFSRWRAALPVPVTEAGPPGVARPSGVRWRRAVPPVPAAPLTRKASYSSCASFFFRFQ